MMYFENFVVYVTSEGKVLREKDGKVELPFKSEYSLGLKNLGTERAVVSVEIDGEDVLGGNRIVLSPNEKIDLEGFIEGWEVKNRFKFIEKTQQIEDYRGNKPEDGLIHVRWQFEKPYVPPTFTVTYKTSDGWYGNGSYTTYGNYGRGSSSGTPKGVDVNWSQSDYDGFGSGYETGYEAQPAMAAFPGVEDENTDGITVKGSETQQNFSYTKVRELGSVNNIVIRLVGYRDGRRIRKPFTVKDKIICETCGHKNPYNAKFCQNCGTFIGGGG